VHQATTPHKLPTLKIRHFIVLAWLLLAAQLFSQLHGLEHLEETDHHEHSKEVCQLCILSSGLEHGNIDTVVISSARLQAPQLPTGCWKSITPTLLPTYQSRAPPSSSSIA
jgi:hypothetical protein